MPLHQLRAVLDAAVDAVIVIDSAGRVLLANAATARLFGWDVDALLGRDVSMLMPEPDRSAHAGYIERFLRTGVPHVIGSGRNVTAMRRDGTCFPARLSIGQVAGVDPPQFVGFIHDLTEQVRETEAARHRHERLMQTTRLATMGEMAAGIAHEVNQPLTAISNYAQAAERLLALPEPDLVDSRDALREIAAEAHRAAEIIRRLRRMVRSAEDAREATRLPELVEELRVLCMADARAHDTRLRFEVQADPPPVFVHRVQITQLLFNLVRNALESVARDPPGGREVIVSGRRSEAGDCEIAVCDNGPGVAPEVRERMFEPFLTTKANGTGLGLPMSQTIAQAHGGSLRHEPADPRGARFILTVPAAEAAR
jgi:two-component system sensor kinase FixL